MATGGAGIPLAVGMVSGGSIGTAVGFIGSILKRSKTFETTLSSEFNRFDTLISYKNRTEVAASILAFGRSLCDYCEAIEKRKEGQSFRVIFEREYNRAFNSLKLLSSDFEKKL